MDFPAWKLTILLLSTLGFLFISRFSLIKPNSHGFYRFFAWETIVLLFLLNVDFWFTHPLRWNQVFSWLFLAASLVPLLWGVILLKKLGKPVTTRPGDQALLSFEKTSRLVTVGIFRFIRHPLYASLLFLTVGLFFKQLSWLGFCLALLASIFILLTAFAEEKEMYKVFGSEYEQYRKHTKRFIPFIF